MKLASSIKRALLTAGLAPTLALGLGAVGFAQDVISETDDTPTICEEMTAESCFEKATEWLKGETIARDEVKARTASAKACSRGVMDACHLFGLLQHAGIGGPSDMMLAHTAFDVACSGDIAGSCYMLAIVALENAEETKGMTPEDLERTKDYAHKACDISLDVEHCELADLLHSPQNGE